jgi:hypothetical protein
LHIGPLHLKFDVANLGEEFPESLMLRSVTYVAHVIGRSGGEAQRVVDRSKRAQAPTLGTLRL